MGDGYRSWKTRTIAKDGWPDLDSKFCSNGHNAAEICTCFVVNSAGGPGQRRRRIEKLAMGPRLSRPAGFYQALSPTETALRLGLIPILGRTCGEWESGLSRSAKMRRMRPDRPILLRIVNARTCAVTTLPPGRSWPRSYQVFAQHSFGWASPARDPTLLDARDAF